jgi:imidazoleglycerol-phosphate dehydratase
MDEALASVSADISGRAFLFFDGRLSCEPVIASADDAHGNGIFRFQTSTIEDFWQGFAGAAGCNLHLEIIRGRSDHHKIEALFKAAARSLRMACEFDERARDAIPSTKGSLPGFDAPGVLV